MKHNYFGNIGFLVEGYFLYFDTGFCNASFLLSLNIISINILISYNIGQSYF